MTIGAWREEPVSRAHDRKGFDCGQAELNDYLARYARQAHESGAAKTYVAVDAEDGVTVLGYYTLSPAQVEFSLVPALARPAGGGRHPVGGFRLARLAVGKAFQGQGFGGQLLVAAAERCIKVSAQVGGTMLLIDAKDRRLADWYKTYGALELPNAPLSLVLPYAVFTEALRLAGQSDA